MSYEPSFIDAVDFTLRQEGLLSDNAHDSGGLTKYGITQATWNNFNISASAPKSVADITVDQAIAVYYAQYWQGPGITKLPRELQGPAFDFAVNSGPDRALKLLPPIPPTATATQLRRIRNDYVTARIVFLADLVQYQAKDVDFIEGWVRRVTKLYDFNY